MYRDRRRPNSSLFEQILWHSSLRLSIASYCFLWWWRIFMYYMYGDRWRPNSSILFEQILWHSSLRLSIASNSFMRRIKMFHFTGFPPQPPIIGVFHCWMTNGCVTRGALEWSILNFHISTPVHPTDPTSSLDRGTNRLSTVLANLLLLCQGFSNFAALFIPDTLYALSAHGLIP